MARKTREDRIAEQDAMREELERRRGASPTSKGRRREAARYATRLVGEDLLLLVAQAAIVVVTAVVGAWAAGTLGLLLGLLGGVALLAMLRIATGLLAVRAGLRNRRAR